MTALALDGRVAALLPEARAAMHSLVGVTPEHSRLVALDQSEWNALCDREGLAKEAVGVYLPRKTRAIVRADTATLAATVFHEYFGHGTYCEHSIPGRLLVDADRRHEPMAKHLFAADMQHPYGFERPDVYNHEGFALWTEKQLCAMLEEHTLWNERHARLPDAYVAALDRFTAYEHDLGRLGFLGQLGMPKRYTGADVADLIKRTYGPGIENVDLVLLTGSRKPYSDIDVFIVSANKSRSIDLGWLDVTELHRDVFAEQLYDLDVNVTDPILSGELVHGSSSLLQGIRQDLQSRPIAPAYGTLAAARADVLDARLAGGEYAERARQTVAGYAASYRAQAPLLAQGIRALTLTDIEQYAGGPVRPHKQLTNSHSTQHG